MQEEKIVVGVDIGTTKICAIVGRLNEFGKLEILGLGKAISDGVKEGTVRNIGKTVAGINQAIKDAAESSKININVVNVGIAGKHIKSTEHHGSITRKSNDDEITQDDVNRLTNDMYRIVTEPGAEIIHVMPQQYTVDFEENIKDPVGMSGVKLEADFHIITAHTNAIRNIKKCVEKASLDIDNMILEPLASSISVLSEEEKEAGIVLVDIGGGTTDVAIFYDGTIRHTAVIPFGGNIITSDIKQGCSVMQNQAEQLKVKFGKALAEEANENEVVSIPGLRNRPPKEISIKNLAYIIEARMEEIIDLIMLEIERSGYQNKLAGGIVITGGGSMLKNLKQLFEYKTGLDARVGYPNEHLGKSFIEEIKNPLYSTAIGLVLAGLRNDETEKDRGLVGGLKHSAKASSGGGGDFFGNILKKTKELLIDDFDDKSAY
ncbi:cell division protein FtsA [Flexithrix dorotheae]|uniref:cell division protein FtsA n=1 Tax=Flexithrix dorotheae TaxID=70993 RepID=UPI000369B952|nr:cell division protein FtsA [Flexithrix dorotheae]